MLSSDRRRQRSDRPIWPRDVEDQFHSELTAPPTLQILGEQVGVHPVTGTSGSSSLKPRTKSPAYGMSSFISR